MSIIIKNNTDKPVAFGYGGASFVVPPKAGGTYVTKMQIEDVTQTFPGGDQRVGTRVNGLKIVQTSSVPKHHNYVVLPAHAAGRVKSGGFQKFMKKNGLVLAEDEAKLKEAEFQKRSAELEAEGARLQAVEAGIAKKTKELGL